MRIGIFRQEGGVQREPIARLSNTAVEHARNPRNTGPLKVFSGHARITGPCGDTMEFWVQVQGDRIEAASFITDGCGASHACGSMATCLAQGKRLCEVRGLDQRAILDALDGLPADHAHCALLAANTLQAACDDHLHKHGGGCGRPECGGAAAGPADAHAANRTAADEAQEQHLAEQLSQIRHRILVLSGKGGVGKSTVAVNLATVLAAAKVRVGLLDIDIHGPSVPTMLGLAGASLRSETGRILPAEAGSLKVISLGLLLRSQDDAVIWRGPMKALVIKQFLADVAWGELDFLIIDSPPGTGDEPLSMCQLLGKVDGAVIVTTPQRVATVDVRKCITFCRQLNVPVLGVIENMKGFRCPKCGELTPILPGDGGARLARERGVPFLGSIPIDPQIAGSSDDGRPFVHQHPESRAAEVLREIARPILNLAEAEPLAAIENGLGA